MRTPISFKSAAGVGALALVLGVFTAVPAQAVPDTEFCPGQAMVPVSDLVEGQQVNGLTTVKGTTPSGFTGEYLTKIDGGLGFDANGDAVDLLMIKVSSPEVDGANGTLPAGIWAGASGSPVYDANGALIGAIAYGFSNEAINVAGVTPAAAMKQIGNLPGVVNLPGQARKEIAAGIGSKVPGTVQQLKLVQVSTKGLSDKNEKLASGVSGYKSVSASGLSDTASKSGLSINGGKTEGADYPIVPGGNIAVSYAYGAVTEASVGTVTAVCGDDVYAYGHPNSWDSTLKASFHGASAALIVPSAGDSYKQVSAIGKPMGSITQDRNAGIKGKLNALPETTTITTVSKVGSHRSEAKTHVSEQWLVAGAAWQQVGNDAMRTLDNLYNGSAKVAWSITYKRANGKTGTLKNVNRYADDYWFPELVGSDLADDIATIKANEFEAVRITDVQVTADFSPDYQAAKLSKVELKTAKGWQKVGNGGVKKAVRGKTYTLRAVLTPTSKSAKTTPEYVQFKVAVPKSIKNSLKVTLEAGYEGDLEFEDVDYQSFDAMIKALDANSRSDQISMTRKFSTKSKTYTKRGTLTAAQVVTDGGYTFTLKAPALKKAKKK